MSIRIIRTLMKRDKLTMVEAVELVRVAKSQLNEYLDSGDIEAAENICEEYFGLEPDYLDDLMFGE